MYYKYQQGLHSKLFSTPQIAYKNLFIYFLPEKPPIPYGQFQVAHKIRFTL